MINISNSENEIVDIYCPDCKKMVPIDGSKITLIVFRGEKNNIDYQFTCPKTNTKQREPIEDINDMWVMEDCGANIIYLHSWKCLRCNKVVNILWKNIYIVIDREEEKAWQEYMCPKKHKHKYSFNILNLEKILDYGPSIRYLNAKEYPPIEYNDILDMHILLEEDDWFEQLENSIKNDPF